ncbi:SIMPL domain-containing protein [Halostagnicola larsenii]|uniref:SIMPL domain-containing protein n=1 Tax=Halostagnicola larsenii TaxID=353800 RepID=UPI0006795369|nr:SIMPL domain-containing protein [Halostagnicola larsenii]
MDRRRLLAATAAGLTVTTAGCLASAVTDNEGQSGDETDSSGNEIEVQATGEVETEPDEAVASIGIEATGDSAEEVSDELAARSETLRETFDDLEIPDERIESGRYEVRTRYEESGYVGTHQFQVEIDDVDRVGEIIDASAAAGADDIGRVNFTLSDELRAEVRDEAIDSALENADDEAAHIADNRGVELTGTKSVSTSNADVQPVRYDASTTAAESDGGAAPTTDIDSGPVTVRASATVVYSFE